MLSFLEKLKFIQPSPTEEKRKNSQNTFELPSALKTNAYSKSISNLREKFAGAGIANPHLN
jgi:hypothetical protein